LGFLVAFKKRGFAMNSKMPRTILWHQPPIVFDKKGCVHTIQFIFMFSNVLIIAVYIVAVVLADVPSAVLFAGLDTFKAMVISGATLETTLPLVFRMVCTAATGHLALFCIASLQPKFRILESVPSLVTFCVIICFQPLIQLFLRVTPARNFLGFGLSWVNNPAARDPQLWFSVVLMLVGLVLTSIVLQKYSA
jgi:hypothetical protein